MKNSIVAACLLAAVQAWPAANGRKPRIHASALLGQILSRSQPPSQGPASEPAGPANSLLSREGINFEVALVKSKSQDRLEAAFYGSIEDGKLQGKLGYYRLALGPAVSSTSACGKIYELPFVNDPLELPGLVLESGPAYFKNRGGLRFKTAELLERGRSRPLRRWPLPEEGGAPIGISEDGRTIYVPYPAASRRLLLAIGPDEVHFTDESKAAGQSWNALDRLPWKGAGAAYQAFGVLKARGTDYYFGLANLCRP